MRRSERRIAGLVFAVMVAEFLAFTLLLTVELYYAEPAKAHQLNRYAVRGGNIRYGSGPDFTFGRARDWGVGQWNRLNKIPIARDTSGTDRDLVFKQYPGTSGTPHARSDAYYDYRPPDVDEIWFNTRRFRNPNLLTNYDKEGVAVHELGHALNLAHPPQTSYWRTHSIMYFDARVTPFHSWQRHDKRDYNLYW